MIKTGTTLAALGAVVMAIAKKTPKPILQAVRVYEREIEGQRVLHFAATDLEIGISQGGISGAYALVHGEKLHQCLRALKEEEFSWEAGPTQATIRSDHAEFTLPIIEGELHPDPITEDPKGTTVTVPARALSSAVKKVEPCVARESARYTMTGICLDIAAAKASAVTTDGRRLAICRIPDAIIVEGKPVQSVVSVGFLSMVCEALADYDGQVEIILSPSAILCRWGDWTAQGRLIEGRFPDCRAIVPKGGTTTIWAGASDLVEAVTRARVMCDHETNRIEITWGTPTRIKAASQTGGGASARADIEKIEGEPVGCAVNPQFLLEALKPIQGAAVVTMDGPARPMKIEDGEGFVAVVMPLT
jgi:DNA polymerase-3 subunit beta